MMSSICIMIGYFICIILGALTRSSNTTNFLLLDILTYLECHLAQEVLEHYIQLFQ